jgi:hypothetical protein
VYGSALNYVNYFAQLGGFTTFLEVMKECNTRMPEVKAEEGKPSSREKELIPFDSLGEFTSAFSNCGALMSETFATNFVD